MVWERFCNASPKPEFFSVSLFIFSFIHVHVSQLIWVHLGWNFHRWFSIQKQVNWCTVDPFSLKFCTSQHSYPVPLMLSSYWGGAKIFIWAGGGFSFGGGGVQKIMCTRALARISELGVQKYTFGGELGIQFLFIPLHYTK